MIANCTLRHMVPSVGLSAIEEQVEKSPSERSSLKDSSSEDPEEQGSTVSQIT